MMNFRLSMQIQQLNVSMNHEIVRISYSISSGPKFIMNPFWRDETEKWEGLEDDAYLWQRGETLLLHVPDELIFRELEAFADVEFRHVNPGEQNALFDGTDLRLLTLGIVRGLAVSRSRAMFRSRLHCEDPAFTEALFLR